MHSRLGVALRAAVVTGTLIYGLLFAATTPANAAEGSCKGPFWGWFQQNICVRVDFGGKNLAARSQWIGWVDVNQGSYGDLHDHRVEMWGDGFYYSGWGGMKINVNKWVRDGTNICGAETEPISHTRQITCVAVHVP